MAVIADELTQTPSALTDAFVEMAEQLRRSTVQVRGRGPGGGSGVIWRPDGLIITNAHVARGPQAIVELADGRTFDAVVTARDERRDLAALKVDATDLPAAAHRRFRCAAGGRARPRGRQPARPDGRADDRRRPRGGVAGWAPRQHGWVQADVRLAPGNSGGPLADAHGRVIGINSMIAGGLALAVPSNAVERFLAGSAARPALGVTMQPVRLPLDGRAILRPAGDGGGGGQPGGSGGPAHRRYDRSARAARSSPGLTA